MKKLLLISSVVLLLSACGRPDELQHNDSLTQQVIDTPNLIEHHYVTSKKGHQLHYVSNASRDQQRPVVVFIHGTPGNWSAYSRYFLDPALNDQYRLIAIDRPGWGESGYSGQTLPTHLQLQSNEIGPMLKDIWQNNGQQKLLIVGHSLGASLAPLLAVDYAKIIAGTLMLAGDVSPQLASPRWYNRLVDWLPNSLVPEKWQNSNDEVLHLAESLHNIRYKFAQLSSPLILLQGQQDTLVTPKNAQLAATLFRNTAPQVEWLEEAGHIIHMTHPEAVKQAIDRLHQQTSRG